MNNQRNWAIEKTDIAPELFVFESAGLESGLEEMVVSLLSEREV